MAAIVRTSNAFAVRLTTLLLAGALLFGAACGDDDSGGADELDDPNETGNTLVTRYITLLQDKDVDGLRGFLSSAFIIQRADGSTAVKDEYLQRMPDLGEFTISNVLAHQAGDTLIVRWSLTIDEVINGQRYSGEPAPRLSTFVYEDGDWRLASHANFNIPEN